MNDVTALTFVILCVLDFNKFIWFYRFYFLLVWVLVLMKIRLKSIIIKTIIVPRFFSISTGKLEEG